MTERRHVHIAAIEPITDKAADLGGVFRVRLSDGSYLAGAVFIEPHPATAGALSEITLRVHASEEIVRQVEALTPEWDIAPAR